MSRGPPFGWGSAATLRQAVSCGVLTTSSLPSTTSNDQHCSGDVSQANSPRASGDLNQHPLDVEQAGSSVLPSLAETGADLPERDLTAMRGSARIGPHRSDHDGVYDQQTANDPLNDHAAVVRDTTVTPEVEYTYEYSKKGEGSAEDEVILQLQFTDGTYLIAGES